VSGRLGEGILLSGTKRRQIKARRGNPAIARIYIIRTSVPAERMEATECVRNYKVLANVERAFRSLETTDLKVRSIYHRTLDRVRAHLFLCLLAYYVEWHMREAWRELMFAAADLSAQAPARPGRAGATFLGGDGQNSPPQTGRRYARAQLLDLDGRAFHARAQYLPRTGHDQCAALRDTHHANVRATLRAQSHRTHPNVVRNQNPDPSAKPCRSGKFRPAGGGTSG
jgi:hypothetical protein